MGISDAIHRELKSDIENEKDFYQTPYECTLALMEHLNAPLVPNKYTGNVLDPCAGDLAITDVLHLYFNHVCHIDKFNDNSDIEDFLERPEGVYHYNYIIMNPPYTNKFAFVKKALDMAEDVYCILPLMANNYTSIIEKLLVQPFYRGKIVCYPKITMSQDNVLKKGGMTTYAWYHFAKEGLDSKEKYEYYVDIRDIKLPEILKQKREKLKNAN